MRFRAPLLSCLACAAFLAAQPAGAVATAGAGASATITQRVSIGVSQNFVLGVTTLPLASISAVVPGGAPGTVSTRSANSVPGRMIGGLPVVQSGAAGAIAQQVGQGATQQASFVILGDSDRSVSIAMPSSIELSLLGGDGEQLEFSPTTTLVLADLGQSRLSMGPDGNGTLAFGVGGRVNLNEETAVGDYAGVLRITVQYN